MVPGGHTKATLSVKGVPQMKLFTIKSMWIAGEIGQFILQNYQRKRGT